MYELYITAIKSGFVDISYNATLNSIDEINEHINSHLKNDAVKIIEIKIKRLI